MCEFDSGTIPSPLSDLLPPQTTASLSVQIFDWDGKPVLLLILCSYTPHFRFDATDRQYLVRRSWALAARMLTFSARRRMLERSRLGVCCGDEFSKQVSFAPRSSRIFVAANDSPPADQAKLAFVSQVSHELRTPLHGIGSQLELIRTLSSPLALKVIGTSCHILSVVLAC